jgi:transposase, IS6 family
MYELRASLDRSIAMQGKQAKIVSPTQERAILGYLATTRYPARGRVIFLLSMKAGRRAKEMAGFVANLHLRRFVLWSLPVLYGGQRGRTTMAISFKGAHFPQDIILMGVRWYVAYPLSYRHVEELMQERGVLVDHATIQRWVVKYSPLLEAAFHRRKRSVWLSWRMDETYIKVKGQWCHLYRAVDAEGNTVEFMLSPTRDAQAAKRFFRKALRARHTTSPRVINVDKNPACPKAVGKLKKKGTLPRRCKLRPIKYLNNLVEQDHRFIKRRVNPESGFWSLETAWRTTQGYEATNQLRKRQVKGTTRADIRSQIRFVAAAFGLAA